MPTTGSSSLVVKISADITDFTKQLDAATKGVDAAAKKLQSLGNSLTIGITLPVIAATAVLFKLADDSESATARMQRTFGDMAGEVKDAIDKMTATVPATTTELENLAIHVDNVVEGMGIAPGNAAKMSESLLQVAADAAAFAHVPINEALDALSSSLSGRGRELNQFGLGFTQAEVKERAMQLGLLQTGNTLTETGTALAAFSLIMDKSNRLHDAAANASQDADVQWQFLKRDAKALGEEIATTLLPAFQEVVDVGKDVVGFFSGVNPEVIKFAAGMLAVAAVAGPLIKTITLLAQGFNTLRAAVTILSTGGKIATMFAEATNPIGQILLAVTALSVAVVALAAAWNAASGAIEGYLNKHVGYTATGLGDRDQQVLGNDPALAAFVKQPGAAGGKNAPSSFNPKDAFQQFQEQAGAASALFDSAVAHGQDLAALTNQINALYTAGSALLDTVNGKLDYQSEKDAEIVQKMLDQLQTRKDIQAVDNAPTTAAANAILAGIGARPIDAGAAGAAAAVKSTTTYATDLATRAAASQYLTPRTAQQTNTEATIATRQNAVDTTNTLDLQLAELSKDVNGLPPGFDAAKQASVNLGLQMQQQAEDQAVQYQTLRMKLSAFGINLGDLSPKMQEAALTIAQAAIGFAEQLAASAGGSGKGAGIGRSIGGLIGSLAGTALGPAGTVIGNLTGAVLGAAVGTVAGSIAGGFLGGAFDKSTASVNNNATAMDTLTKTVNAVTASITNIPQFFKVEYYRFQAAPVIPATPGTPTPGAPTYPTTPGSPAAPPGGGPINPGAPNGSVFVQTLNLSVSASDPKTFLDGLHEQILRRRATGSAARLSFSGGIG